MHPSNDTNPPVSLRQPPRRCLSAPPGDYWGWYNKRWYHHTGMVSTWYGMREAYAVMAEEGLPAMWARHRAVHEQLWEGLTDLGLDPFVEKEDDRLVTVNAIKVR